jgi:hypothetical protein
MASDALTASRASLNERKDWGGGMIVPKELWKES